MLHTIEEILGTGNLSLSDSSAKVMTDVFDIKQTDWTYSAMPSDLLYNTQLPLPARRQNTQIPWPTHDAAYWFAATKGMDFSVEDRVDPVVFNQILWRGLMGEEAYPAISTGIDLSNNRKELLSRYQMPPQRKTVHQN
jgi:hypothetical protein